MVKTYLKYALSQITGLTTGKCRPVVHESNRFFFAAKNDIVIGIDSKLGKVIQLFKCEIIKDSEISFLEIANDFLFVGYDSGAIVQLRINILSFDNLSSSIGLNDVSKENLISYESKFCLHKSSITYLLFDKENNQLLSSSKDTNILVWDILSEAVLYKFNGHKDTIIKAIFYNISLDDIDGVQRVIVSCSRDNTIKIWDIKSQECIQTIANLTNKINYFVILETNLIIATQSNKALIYKLASTKNNTVATLKGSLIRQTHSKVTSMEISSDMKLLMIFSKDNTIEFFKILSKNELIYRLILSDKKKETETKNLKETKEKAESLVSSEDYNFNLKFYSLFKFFDQNEINFFFVLNNFQNYKKKTDGSYSLRLYLSMNNNSIEIYELKASCIKENLFKAAFDSNLPQPEINENNLSIEHTYSLDFGHKEIIRCVKFSSSNTKFLSISSDCIRIWNYTNKSESLTKGYIDFSTEYGKIKTIDSFESIKKIIIEGESPLVGIFLNGDEFIVIGTKQGKIHIFEVSSCNCLCSISAHDEEIWNIVPLKMNRQLFIVSCSSDKKINYFKVNFTEEGSLKEEALTLDNSILAQDQITYMQITPNKKYLIYSLLDNTIRINYTDSGKQFLNLHDHKLPVINFDVSSDSTLLVSASSDKNIKIWGLDFGDCHKSIFAHKSAVTCVKFVNKTHYFFSCSKDGAIKYWDADKFELIIEYNDFHGEIWSLDVNLLGTTLVSCSADRSIKVYELTKEQIIPDMEKEKTFDKQIEDEFQKDIDMQTSTNMLNKNINDLISVKKTLENITFCEELVEAIDLCEKFKEEVYQYEIGLLEYNQSIEKMKNKQESTVKMYNLELPEKPVIPFEFMGKNIFEYMIFVLKKITPLSELENTLNNLPYAYVQQLLFYLEFYVRNRNEVELASRCLIFLFKLYETQFSNDKTLVRSLESISKNMRESLQEMKETLNYNISAMKCLERVYVNRKEAVLEQRNII